MRKKRYYASFFVDKNGIAIKKAKPINFKTRKYIFDRDGHRCKICNRDVVLFKPINYPNCNYGWAAIDHIFPVARGGQNNYDNLRLLCWSCNASKGAKLNGELQ